MYGSWKETVYYLMLTKIFIRHPITHKKCNWNKSMWDLPHTNTLQKDGHPLLAYLYLAGATSYSISP